MANCNYKVNMKDIQNKYKFKIFGLQGPKGETGEIGTPLVASSISDMTDTTRVYVNTTDGKWYYYNGSAWTIGGVYQSTGIADNSVDPNKLSTNLQEVINYDYHDFPYTLCPDGFLKVTNVREAGPVGTEKIPVVPGDKFRISGRVGGTIYLYILLDSNNNIVSFFPTSGVVYGTVYTDELLTIPEGISDIVVNSTSEEWIKIEKKTIGKINDYLDLDYIQNNMVNNELYEKTAIFAGDSICHGTSVGQDDPTYGYGWAGRIGIKNNMTWRNYGVSGAIVAMGYTGKHSILGDVATMASAYPNADYIIFEGGVNDALTEGESIGTITSDYTNNFDTSTFCGALESLFYSALSSWVGKKIGFIIPHKMGSVSGQELMNTYHEKAREICHKWSIPYIDLYYESTLNSNIPNQLSSLFANGSDTWHLSAEGYDVITPKIEAWMKTL